MTYPYLVLGNYRAIRNAENTFSLTLLPPVNRTSSAISTSFSINAMIKAKAATGGCLLLVWILITEKKAANATLVFAGYNTAPVTCFGGRKERDLKLCKQRGREEFY